MSVSMRVRAGAVVCLATTVACSSENQLVYVSTLDAQTQGVALSEDGLDAFAGMVEQTCEIDTHWGCATADADITASVDERVVDHWGGRTLAMSSVGLHTIVNGAWDAAADVALPEVRTAGLFAGGHATVYGHFGACWLQRGDGAPVQVADEACDDGVQFTMSRATGAVFAGTMSGVYALDEQGYRLLASSGNLVAYDHSLGLIYAATRGSTALRAIDEADEVVWEVVTGGPIHSIAARGNVGEVLVLIDRPDGLGVVERRDGPSGRLLGTSIVAEGDDELMVSDNGATVATVDEEDGVDFYDLPAGTTATTVDPTPPQCITPTINGGSVNVGD